MMNVSLCLSVCLSNHILEITHLIFAKFSLHDTFGRGSILFWWRYYTLYTSGFVDDVMFACNGQEWATRQRRILKVNRQMAAQIGIAPYT